MHVTGGSFAIRVSQTKPFRAQFHHVYRFALDVSRVTSRDRLKCFDVLTRNSIHVVRSRVQGKVTMVKMATAWALARRSCDLSTSKYFQRDHACTQENKFLLSYFCVHCYLISVLASWNNYKSGSGTIQRMSTQRSPRKVEGWHNTQDVRFQKMKNAEKTWKW